MIAHRSTVFEENSIIFMHRRNIRITEELPVGYLTSWPKRGQLAVTKQAATLNSGMTVSDFPTLLAAEGANPEDDRFVEVHIYGPISIRAVAEVSLRARGTAIRRKALREKLAKFGIPVTDH